METQQQRQVEFVRGCYYGYHSINKLKTFLDIGRESGITWLSARGIQDKYGCDVNKYFRRRFSISSGIPDDQLNAYCGRLLMDMVVNPVSGKQVVTFAKSVIPEWDQSLANTQQPNEPVKDAIKPTVPVSAPTQPIVEKSTEQVKAAFSLNINVADMVSAGIADYINNSGVLNEVNNRIMQEAAKLRPKHNAITVDNAEPVIIEGKLHKAFKKCLNKIIKHKQIYLQGQAGTGKTMLAEQIAKSLSLMFGHISCTGGMSEAHLLGRMTAHGDYTSSLFVDFYENGGVFLLDEVDAADNNTILVINSALANGMLSVPNRKDNNIAKRHDKFYLIACGNTFGNGSNEFSGRNMQDGAFMDRFAMSKILIDYDLDLENEISVVRPEIAQTFQSIRSNVLKHKIRRQVTTRAIAGACRESESTLKEIIADFQLGWTEQEIIKSLENISL